jgi:HrpA-like RNA helicase
MSSGTFWKPAPATTSLLRDDDGRNQESVAAAAYYHPKNRTSLSHQRMLLPIYKHKRQILYALEHYGVVVIVGGKFHQPPQASHTPTSSSPSPSLP